MLSDFRLVRLVYQLEIDFVIEYIFNNDKSAY